MKKGKVGYPDEWEGGEGDKGEEEGRKNRNLPKKGRDREKG